MGKNIPGRLELEMSFIAETKGQGILRPSRRGSQSRANVVGVGFVLIDGKVA